MPKIKSTVDKDIEKEYEFYLSQPQEWKEENRGKIVLIKDQKIHGLFVAYEDALQDGLKQFGNVKFLLHEIGSEEIVHYTTPSLIGAI